MGDCDDDYESDACACAGACVLRARGRVAATFAGGWVRTLADVGAGMKADIDAMSLTSESLASDMICTLELSLNAVSCRSRSMSSTFTGPRMDVADGGGGAGAFSGSGGLALDPNMFPRKDGIPPVPAVLDGF